MNNCFIELPQPELPIKAKDCFNEYDWLVAETIATMRERDMFTPVADMEEAYTKGNFRWNHSTVTGLLQNNKIGRLLWEWLSDNVNEEFIRGIFKPHGKVLFPVTVVGFAGPSTWHREGRAPIHQQIDPNYYFNRSSTVLNFKMVGDSENCEIVFGKPKKEFDDIDRELAIEYVRFKDFCQEHISKGLKQEEIKKLALLEFPEYDGIDGLYLPQDQRTFNKGFDHTWFPHSHIQNEDQSLVIRDHVDTVPRNKEHNWGTGLSLGDTFEIFERKTGYDSPVLLNLAQWHKVNIWAPEGKEIPYRFTMRFMSDPSVPFSHYEKMYYEGNFFK